MWQDSADHHHRTGPWQQLAPLHVLLFWSLLCLSCAFSTCEFAGGRVGQNGDPWAKGYSMRIATQPNMQGRAHFATSQRDPGATVMYIEYGLDTMLVEYEIDRTGAGCYRVRDTASRALLEGEFEELIPRAQTDIAAVVPDTRPPRVRSCAEGLASIVALIWSDSITNGYASDHGVTAVLLRGGKRQRPVLWARVFLGTLWMVGCLVVWRWHLRRYRRRANLCMNCGYDLRASPTRCPECGTEIGTLRMPLSSNSAAGESRQRTRE